MGAPVTWFEITSRSSRYPPRVLRQVIGWNTQQVVDEPPYALVETGPDGAISGGIAEAQGPNQVTFYIEVDDLQTYLDRIEGPAARPSSR